MGGQDWDQDPWRRQFGQDDQAIERSRIEGTGRQGSRRQWRPLVVALAALLVIAGAVGSLGVYTGHWLSPAARRTATPEPILPLLSIDTSPAQSCPTGVAWSPDGLKLAVAVDGEQSQCDTADPGRTQALILYDARSGAQLKYINVLDTFRQLNINMFNAFAEQPSWSPDGGTIVLPFLIEATPSLSVGLLVIPVGSGAPRALLYTTDTAETSHPIWNLKTGKLATLQTKALPPALTYTWSADGSIQSGEAIPPGNSATYTGSPVEKVGGASFSRWQRGVIWPVVRAYVPGPPIAWFQLDGGALWSPDGQYVAPNYSIETRLPEPAGRAPAELQSQDFLSTCGDFGNPSMENTYWENTYCAQPALPYPDAAYAKVVAAARAGLQEKDSSGRAVTGWPPVEIAWRPDGKVLATMLPADDFAAFPSMVRVTLYDTATGQALTALSQSVSLPSSQVNGPYYLSWSPTGQQLALVDNGDSRIIVWGASSLASLPPVAAR